MSLAYKGSQIQTQILNLIMVQMRTGTLFGSLSSGVTTKTKYVAWQSGAQAVNEVVVQ